MNAPLLLAGELRAPGRFGTLSPLVQPHNLQAAGVPPPPKPKAQQIHGQAEEAVGWRLRAKQGSLLLRRQKYRTLGHVVTCHRSRAAAGRSPNLPQGPGRRLPAYQPHKLRLWDPDPGILGGSLAAVAQPRGSHGRRDRFILMQLLTALLLRRRASTMGSCCWLLWD